MDYDEVTQTHDATNNEWNQRLGVYNTSGIEKLASKYNNDMSCTCVEATSGSFNMCFKVIFANNTAWAVRFPVPGRVMYPEEKVRREVAVMSFIQAKTRIPSPRLIASGAATDNHDPAMGPFIITEWVNGVSLSSIMEELPRPEWGPVLRKDITDNQLYNIYRQMARIYLELAKHDFEKIGNLLEVKDNDNNCTWSITSRPMTLKMNEIERAGYVTMDDHCLPPFDIVTEYMEYLAQQNVDHLHQQKNSVDNADDARRKYILRQQVQAVIEQFVSKEYNSGPFKLFCDDLRPGNVIIHPETYEIVALIDLEWTYTAPYQFLYSPPPWLILEKPIEWTSNDVASYMAKFHIFVKSLEDEEETWEKEGCLDVSLEQRMSTLMRRSMDDGKFWFGCLLRQSYAFDGDVLWPQVEAFLQNEGLDLEAISNEMDTAEMEAFVERKIEDLRRYESNLQSLKSDEKKGAATES